MTDGVAADISLRIVLHLAPLELPRRHNVILNQPWSDQIQATLAVVIASYTLP